MGLQVMTQEIHADFGGFHVEVCSPPAHQCEPPTACTEDGMREVIFDAGERDDGAVGSRLVIRGQGAQLATMLRSALSYLEPTT